MRAVLGSCHCGAVTWKLELPVKTIVKCHCGNCRKLQGSDYSTWVVTDPAHFSLQTGLEALSEYKTFLSSKRFCSVCGSAVALSNGKHYPGDVILPLGALDTYANELSPKAQVYTADKASWVVLHPDEPLFS